MAGRRLGLTAVVALAVVLFTALGLYVLSAPPTARGRGRAATGGGAPRMAGRDGDADAESRTRCRDEVNDVTSTLAAHAPPAEALAVLARDEALRAHAAWLDGVLPRSAMVLGTPASDAYGLDDAVADAADDLQLLLMPAGPQAQTQAQVHARTSPPAAMAGLSGGGGDVCSLMPYALVCQPLHIVTVRATGAGEPLSWLRADDSAAASAPAPAAGERSDDNRYQSQYRAVTRTVYDHTNPLSVAYFGPNVGAEAHAYVRFIADQYHSLPAVVVFVHARPTQHNARIHTYIAALCATRDPARDCPDAYAATAGDPIGFTPLNVPRADPFDADADADAEAAAAGPPTAETSDDPMGDTTPPPPPPDRAPSELRRPGTDGTSTAREVYYVRRPLTPARHDDVLKHAVDEYHLWSRTLQRLHPLPGGVGDFSPLLPAAPAESQSIGLYCCAQMAVSRRAITRLPHAFWLWLLSRMTEQSIRWQSTRKYGAVMEHSWHALFTGAWDSPRYTASDHHRAIYCRAFLPGRCPIA